MHAKAANSARKFLDKAFPVTLTRGLRYGGGGVDYSKETGAPRLRPLLLDVYEPDGDITPLRPALILAFGGAFQRNSRENDVTIEGEHRNTAIAEYCHEFAQRGYVCFSIDYRLMGESPDPGITPTWPPAAPMPNVDRANYVRGLLGQPLCTPQMMKDTVEAATDDMSQAIAFVHREASRMRIDPDRIVCGGFSAGATIAINATYGERARVAAVVAISGRMPLAAAEAFVKSADDPRLLMFYGERDLPGALEDLEARSAYFDTIGFRHDLVIVPGATHFYPRNSEIRSSRGIEDVESKIAAFLVEALGL